MDRRTEDGRTDGPTGRPSYRDAWTHLRIVTHPFQQKGAVPLPLSIHSRNQELMNRAVIDQMAFVSQQAFGAIAN